MKITIASLRSRARSLGVYAFALGAGLLAAWAAREHIQARVREIEREAEVVMAERLVAAEDLPAGTRLQAAHLAVRDVPLPWVTSGMLEPDAADHAIGAVLANDVGQGDPLLDMHLVREAAAPPVSELLAAGRRAVTLPADEINAASGILRAGDVIDLYVSFAHRGQQLTAPLLQGVRVLAAGGGPDAAPSITLDTTPQDAIKLIAARQAGALTAMLRHRGDAAVPGPSTSGDLAALMGLEAPGASPRRAVQILYGDRVDAEAPRDPDGAAADLPAGGAP